MRLSQIISFPGLFGCSSFGSVGSLLYRASSFLRALAPQFLGSPGGQSDGFDVFVWKVAFQEFANGIFIVCDAGIAQLAPVRWEQELVDWLINVRCKE